MLGILITTKMAELPHILYKLISNWFFWSMFLGGVSAFISSLYNIFLAFRSSIWPIAQGKIIVSSVRMDIDADGEIYGPEIKYRYNVLNQEYIGDVIALGSLLVRTSNLESCNRYTSRYTLDAIVNVHYNPRNPQCSTLKTGISFSSFQEIFFSIPFLLIGSYTFASKIDCSYIVGAVIAMIGIYYSKSDR